jgi:hypothetical protein
MKIALVTVVGVAPYSQSRQHFAAKEDKETHDDYERRTWRERVHAGQDGECFIPPMAFKRALEKAAAFLSIPIPGKGSAKYTKHFLSGVLVMDPVPLGVAKDDVEGEWLSLSPRGRRGEMGVMRCMPIFREWSGTVRYMLLDGTITPAVFERVVSESGNFVGIGRFRPENGGFYGRFGVAKIEWTEA